MVYFSCVQFDVQSDHFVFIQNLQKKCLFELGGTLLVQIYLCKVLLLAALETFRCFVEAFIENLSVVIQYLWNFSEESCVKSTGQ